MKDLSPPDSWNDHFKKIKYYKANNTKLPWIITLIIQNALLSFGGFEPHWPSWEDSLSIDYDYDDKFCEQSSLNKVFLAFVILDELILMKGSAEVWSFKVELRYVFFILGFVICLKSIYINIRFQAYWQTCNFWRDKAIL